MRKVTIALATLLCLFACRPQQTDGRLRSGREVQALMRETRAGNGAAASELAMHYSARGDTPARNRWLLRAAELGECAAISVLREEKDPTLSPRLDQLWADLGCETPIRGSIM